MDNPSQFVIQNKMTAESIQFYHDYGYLIAPDLIFAEDVAVFKF